MNFEALLTHSPNPYIVIDRDLVISWMNDAYLKATMRERSQLLGKGIFEAFPSPESSDSNKLLQASFDRVLTTRQADEIAHIRYDIEAPNGGMEQRFWSATHTPQLDEDGEVKYILQHTVDVTELQGLRRLRDEAGLIDRAKAVQAKNFDLARETEWLRDVFDQAPGFTAILEGAEHRFILANRAFRELRGDHNLIGMRLLDALPEWGGTGFAAQLDAVVASGTPFIGTGVELKFGTGPSANTGNRFFDLFYQPIIAPEGSVSGVFVQGHDVTAQVTAQERQCALIEELNHRVKNNLAVIQGIANQAFRSIPGSEKARSAFEGRLFALSAAHEILASNSWQPVSFERLVMAVIGKSLPPGQLQVFTFKGPAVAIPPGKAGSLALVLNELVANALSHGALSQQGRIAMTWGHDATIGDGKILIDWDEQNYVIAADHAGRAGFGLRYLRGIASAEGGSAETEFRPDGFRYKAVFSLV
jgi:PAS domain S-box-containing protein